MKAVCDKPLEPRAVGRRVSRSFSVLCVILPMTGWTSDPSSSPPNVAPPVTPPTSELSIADRQTLIIREATKLSAACRMFRSLYGRWPSDVAEIQSRTEGLNFAIFAGGVRVTPLPDDAERIEVFDGVNTRAVKATPVDFGFTAAQREEAKSPGYKIKL
jgi:hypothetical protein